MAKKTTTKKGNINQNVNERLNEVLTINTDSFSETIESEDGKTEIIKKSYDLINPIGKRSTITVYDLGIIESMEKINSALHGKTFLSYVICKEFANIVKTGKIENMGFKSIAEFGKAIYDLEPSTVNHYTRIGEHFISDDYIVKAGLPELSVSHFIELSSQVGENGDISPIIELYTSGTLTDGMSTKAIRKTLKNLSNNALEDKGTTPDANTKEESSINSENEATVIMNESEVEELQANFDSQVVVGKIINACSIIETLFTMLNENEISVIGYSEKLDSIKALAKALL